MQPFSISSDQHANNWSAFSTTLSTGVNSRLDMILSELARQADEVLAAGGNTIFFAGDLFHVRGSVDPSVLNPVVETIKTQVRKGVRYFAIPGNHDLKSNDTTELGNAIQVLGDLPGFTVITKPSIVDVDDHGVAMIPWRATLDGLRADVATLAAEHSVGTMDLIIHAPINGSLPEVFDNALDPAEVADWGFRRVFSGHFHNHANTGPGVFSVGALTHQTWRDIGSKAGFLLVDDFVNYRASRAPKFIEVGEEDVADEATLALKVDGNYVRVRYETITPAQEKEIRQGLDDMGAAGVVIQAARAPSTTRTGATIKTGATLDASVSDYVRTLAHPHEAAVNALCADVLRQVRERADAE
jgi:DNA repair exonuclease SbcCD nuclease subunit